MGSKTPEHHQQVPNCPDRNAFKAADLCTKASLNAANSADLDRGLVSGGDDDEDDDDDDRQPGAGLTDHDAQTKKKNKKSRKRSKKKKSPTLLEQTSPPSVQVSDLFPSGCAPGQLVPYENTARVTDEEVRYDSRKWDAGFLKEYREAAEIHRQVRHYVQKEVIKPGVSLSEVADEIENGVRALCGHQGLEPGDGLKAGLAFPTGLCLNNIAAHWTPNPSGKDVVMAQGDVLKVDFGVHVNGRIVDSAFTVAFDDTYDNLLAAVKDATNTGISHAGPDARIAEISAAIQEAMESYEVEIDGKVHPIRAVRNLTGHDILRYRIHGNKQIPFTKNNSKQKMEEGEVFAIETFGSTGRGHLRDDIGIYGYGRQPDVSPIGLSSPLAKGLLKTIDANFGSLVFCRRYLERLGTTKYHLGMKQLVDHGVVESYAPLIDVPGSYTAQFEHTILLHSSGKEVISRGDDY